MLGAGRPAAADSIERRLARAKVDRQAAEATVRRLERRADRLIAAYADSQGTLRDAVVDVVASYGEQLAVSAELAGAQELLNRQAATAYEAGPGLSMELALGAASSGDLASIGIYTERTIGVSSRNVQRVQVLRTALRAATADLERRRRTLVTTANGLRDSAVNALADLAHAREAAMNAGAKVDNLARQQDALAAAFAVGNSTMAALTDAQRGLDQRDLLALLGPTQGRGCDLPSGLADTGQRMSGISSWYGWELAGHPTATGAIYDPRLFTAANKELPLNSFIRVHFNGQCAVVLVNDRGPYKPGRVFDLSQAAAEYLGVSLNFVTADILIPVR